MEEEPRKCKYVSIQSVCNSHYLSAFHNADNEKYSVSMLERNE